MVDDQVTLHHPRTGHVHPVAAAAVPFFTNQGYQPLDAEPDSEPAGQREAPDPADVADPGASTTPTPISLSKEN